MVAGDKKKVVRIEPLLALTEEAELQVISNDDKITIKSIIA